ncbi:uncharacterized protein LOC133714637 isoform X2 [Rosa rugosa]|uniref:uncharacterized protein LOC133714637 isoform X2 n=1 Tax=Rosa rugosa TaxID=74645 RepID=UPI002B4071D7|nr:uncharacterized protein LOC133714637 isoform X2 [Rosa rugosa]
MDSMLIRELQSYADEDYKIRVCVCRLWRGKRINPERNDGLHCILVDERGDAIHGITSEANYSSVSGKLKQGEIYLISDFYVRDSQDDYKVMDNSIQAHFNGKTKFKLLHNSFPQIPQHRFYLLDYNQLKNRIGKTKLLTVEEVNTRDGIESKCEITLQNFRREETRVTLWGDSARKVDIDTIESLPPPVLMVITSLKVKKYKEMPAPSNTSHTCIFINPEIPQADPYKIDYRIHATIEDPNSEATVKLRGKAAEQLFGITCKELIDKYPYAPQETLPQEILQTRADPHFPNPNQ